ncbi:hypothetical protein O3P69_010294 [Scylla paramamosain]|uniref:DDE-1 domain-containing protein n=1 Tax=Scylla paramamosain TaxID=85552 RepID=A0AAW0TSN2_SCYPA
MIYHSENPRALKILLLVDNTPSHQPSLQNLSSNIKLAFLPPNTTSLLQSCDQGLIQTFKSYYLRSVMATAVKFVHLFSGFTVDDIIQKANKQTLAYAKDLGLEEVEHDDIEQLQSHRQELTNEDQIEMKAEKQ